MTLQHYGMFINSPLPKGQSNVDTPDTLKIWGTQDEEKRNKRKKSITQYVLDTIIRKQTQIT